MLRCRFDTEELAKEFEPSAQAIRNWVAQADRDEGRREDGLTTAEREELNCLRRENRQLTLEQSRGLVRSGDGRDPAEGFQFVSDRLPHRRDVPRLGCLPQRLLRVGQAAGVWMMS